MKATLICFVLVLISPSLFAQPPDSLWSRTFGGSNADVCSSVQQTSDGGYILGGHTGLDVGGIYDMLLVKTDENGDSLWSRTYGGSNNDGCGSVLQTSDGGYILAGFTRSFGAGETDAWLVKTDTNGDSLWSRTYGGSSTDFCGSVQQTSDGGYILGGGTSSFSAGQSDMWLVKTDANGDSLWSRSFGGSDDEWCNSMRQTSDGYILAGEIWSWSSGNWENDMLLVKADVNGNQEWSRTYGGSGYDVCYSVGQANDGGYILGGGTSSFGPVGVNFWLVKTDANGLLQWSRTFGGSNFEYCNSVQPTADGGYILGGHTTSFGAGNYDMWLVKTDENGDSLWSRTFGGINYDECYSVQETADGGYILGGETQSFGAGGRDMWLVKTGPDAAPPPLRILSPNGGNQWPLYSTQTVTWASDSISGLMRIELNRSYPNGTWEMLADNTPDDNQEQVTVSGPFSSTCRVRISLVGDTLADISDGNFSITNPLRVTAPNGGEQWPLFSTQTVTWASDNMDGFVRIELIHNYPNGSWELLVDNTPDDNEEAVFVSGGASSNCRIRISLIGDTLTDISNGNFAITTSAGTLRMVNPLYPNLPVNMWYAGVLETPDTLSDTYRLKNFGSEQIVVLPPLEPISAEFSVSSLCDTLTLSPGEMSTCDVTLLYHPQEGGQHRDTLLIRTNASNGDINNFYRVPLEGQLILSADEQSTVPKAFALHPVFPNPFNSTTTIRYDLPATGPVRVIVFDLAGREVVTLAHGIQEAGTHELRFNGTILGSGVYLCRMEAGSFSAAQKVVLLK